VNRIVNVDETGSSNLNLQQKMFDFSPEDVCGYPKTGKRKIERKGHTKGPQAHLK
jgi:hypothetical protein